MDKSGKVISTDLYIEYNGEHDIVLFVSVSSVSSPVDGYPDSFLEILKKIFTTKSIKGVHDIEEVIGQPKNIDSSFLYGLLVSLNLYRANRTVWEEQIGLRYGERVADHSWGVIMILLLTSPPGDWPRVLPMAVIHDLSESVVRDYTPLDNVPVHLKHQLEEAALEILFKELPFKDEFMALIKEYNAEESKTARQVKKADKEDVLLTGELYERFKSHPIFGDIVVNSLQKLKELRQPSLYRPDRRNCAESEQADFARSRLKEIFVLKELFRNRRKNKSYSPKSYAARSWGVSWLSLALGHPSFRAESIAMAAMREISSIRNGGITPFPIRQSYGVEDIERELRILHDILEPFPNRDILLQKREDYLTGMTKESSLVRIISALETGLQLAIDYNDIRYAQEAFIKYRKRSRELYKGTDLDDPLRNIDSGASSSAVKVSQKAEDAIEAVRKKAAGMLSRLEKGNGRLSSDKEWVREILQRVGSGDNRELSVRSWLRRLRGARLGLNKYLQSKQPDLYETPGENVRLPKGTYGSQYELQCLFVLLDTACEACREAVHEEEKQEMSVEMPLVKNRIPRTASSGVVRSLSSDKYEINPLLAVANNSDLRAFIVQMLRKRYTFWGMPDNLSGRIVDTVLLHKDNLTAARDAVYHDVINFKTHQLWRKSYQQYKETNKYASAYNYIRVFFNDLRDDSVVVDWGAGNNALGAQIAQANQGLHVIGVDIKDDRKDDDLRSQSSLQNLSFKLLHSPTQCPDISDESVDIIVMNAALHHVEDMKNLLLEMRRMLKSTGQLVLIEDTYSATLPFAETSDSVLSNEFIRLVRKHGNKFAKDFLMFNDWYSNFVVAKDDAMVIPYGFKSIEEWEEFLRLQGFCLSIANHVGFPAKGFHKPALGVLVFKKVLSAASPVTSRGHSHLPFQTDRVLEDSCHNANMRSWPAGLLPGALILAKTGLLGYWRDIEGIKANKGYYDWTSGLSPPSGKSKDSFLLASFNSHFPHFISSLAAVSSIGSSPVKKNQLSVFDYFSNTLQNIGLSQWSVDSILKTIRPLEDAERRLSILDSLANSLKLKNLYKWDIGFIVKTIAPLEDIEKRAAIVDSLSNVLKSNGLDELEIGAIIKAIVPLEDIEEIAERIKKSVSEIVSLRQILQSLEWSEKRRRSILGRIAPLDNIESVIEKIKQAIARFPETERERKALRSELQDKKKQGRFLRSILEVNNNGSGFVAGKIKSYYVIITNTHVVSKKVGRKGSVSLTTKSGNKEKEIGKASLVLRHEQNKSYTGDIAILLVKEENVRGGNLESMEIGGFNEGDFAALVSGSNGTVLAGELLRLGDVVFLVSEEDAGNG
ncbi:MAG: HD domain-containing protein, partial [Candidatus Omnitrophica bacterium]|nr:HD domain-containing protein [Candidatus Omnitrophota bacterium]